MPNKHFCQGPTCHEQTTADRFLKSKGIIRGRYAYATMDRTPTSWGYTPNGSDVYFCSQRCKFDWLSLNMENIEQGRYNWGNDNSLNHWDFFCNQSCLMDFMREHITIRLTQYQNHLTNVTLVLTLLMN